MGEGILAFNYAERFVNGRRDAMLCSGHPPWTVVFSQQAFQVLLEAAVLRWGQVQAVPNSPQELHVRVGARIQVICLHSIKHRQRHIKRLNDLAEVAGAC